MRIASLLVFVTLITRTGRLAAHDVSAGHADSHNPLESFNVAGLKLRGDASAELKVSASSFRSGDWVEVSWSRVERPALDDLVALYAPADADVQATAPVKFIWAIKSPSHIVNGSGSYRFRLVNLRVPMRFAFLRSGLLSPEFETFSNTVHPENPNEPLQVHLALTKNPGEMLAQWTSLDKSLRSGVRWGSQPGNPRRSSLSVVQSYSKGDMCGEPANSTGWLEPGLLHQALMTNLQPSTRYYYSVGDLDYEFSSEFSFVTPPLTSPSASVKFLAIADLGSAEIDGSMEHTEMLASLNTTARLAQETEHHQLLIHNGDISYARGFASIWDAYWDQMMPLTSKMPYMAVPGNHERDWPGSGDRFGNGAVYDSGGECGVAFERRVKMPLSAPDKFWYSFDFGPIHFLQYSTEHPFQPGSEQHEFVLSDLKAVNRKRTPWLIVGGHRPFVVDSSFNRTPDGDLDVSHDLQVAFEDAFMQYGVDMTWHGHHHSYQRTCALHKGACMPPNEDGSQNAPIHLVVGHAGAGLSFTVQYQKPGIFEVVKVEHGYMRVQANGTSLVCEVISSTDGSLMDRVALKRPSTELQERQNEVLMGSNEVLVAQNSWMQRWLAKIDLLQALRRRKYSML